MPLHSEDRFPRFRENWWVRVHLVDGTRMVKILAVRPMGRHRHNWGSLTAGTASQNNQCTHLQVPDGQMAQYRFKALHAFEVDLKHPPTTTYFVGRNPSTTVGENWRIDPWDEEASDYDKELAYKASEFFVWENDDPRFDLYPLNSAQNPRGHIEFYGYRYLMQVYDSQGEAEAAEGPISHKDDLYLSTFATRTRI